MARRATDLREWATVQWTNHVISTCCASVALEDEASGSSLDRLDPRDVLCVGIPEGAGTLQERPHERIVCQFGFDGTGLQISAEES